ncbi:GAD-like domain-containing protein [Candidatus Clostridium stratigraminis]|uniref:GAD-like domain-containing protein n=1 Tax=Candidatus Clostridium stratigraminis TaxID=3381661 RepID=A0ABW8T0L8_9CLOT
MKHEKFLNSYLPDESCKSLSTETISKYKEIAPDILLSLWTNNGVGKYGNGIVEIINPEEYQMVLEMWFGKEVPNYIPFMISGFGHLFYYRKLTVEDEDVICLDPHYKKTFNCTWNINTFFNSFLLSDDIIKTLLKKDLFIEGTEKVGKLHDGEILFFEPALCLGGSEELKYINKGNVIIHHQLLRQM